MIFWHPWDPWGRVNSGKNFFGVQTASVYLLKTKGHWNAKRNLTYVILSKKKTYIFRGAALYTIYVHFLERKMKWILATFTSKQRPLVHTALESTKYTNSLPLVQHCKKPEHKLKESLKTFALLWWICKKKQAKKICNCNCRLVHIYLSLINIFNNTFSLFLLLQILSTIHMIPLRVLFFDIFLFIKLAILNHFVML